VGRYAKGITSNTDVYLLLAKVFGQSSGEPARKTNTKEMWRAPYRVNDIETQSGGFCCNDCGSLAKARLNSRNPPLKYLQ
jgi:hypothetical protein